jgi:hypothetical protein
VGLPLLPTTSRVDVEVLSERPSSGSDNHKEHRSSPLRSHLFSLTHRSSTLWCSFSHTASSCHIQSLHVSAVRVKGKIIPVLNGVLKHYAKKTYVLKSMLK